MDLFANIERKLRRGRKSEQILKAPTGSGKTVMLSELIKAISELREHPMCFLWVTPGKGGLALQSYISLKSSITGPKVSMLSDEFIGSRKSIDRDEVVVLNWEKVVKAGNLMMREGERTNFPELIRNTRANGLKICLLVDESHRNLETDKSKQILSIVDPDIIIEASATPNKAPTVTVRYEDAKKAGFIKQGVIINKEDLEVEDTDEYMWVFKSADVALSRIKKRFIKRHKKGGTLINPLKLINISNVKRDEEDKQLEMVLAYEESVGRTVENGKVVIYTNSMKTIKDIHSEDLKSFDSIVEVVVFKQALVEGFDCPRSCVMVELRGNMGATFKEQVTGRLFRAPERICYGDYWLDNAFVFTNQKDFTIEQNDGGIMYSEVSSSLIDKRNFGLKSSYVKQDWNDIKIEDGKFSKIFWEVAEQDCGIEEE